METPIIPTICIILSIALGGAIGACLRYAVSRFCAYYALNFLPFATLFVNLIGSFVMGMLGTGFLLKSSHNSLVYFFALTGLLGAFTTFSTFANETYMLWQKKQWGCAFAFVFLNVFGGLVCAFLGMLCALI